VNVGVTGHRLDRVGQDQLDQATPVLDSLLETISTVTHGLCAQERKFFADAVPGLRLLSGLAEGSDRHVATVASARGYSLHAILPFERGRYSADFQSPESLAAFHGMLANAERVFEMPGDRAEPDRAYEMAGLGIVAHSDVLVAIWDGSESRGPGGTAEVIRVALKRGLPVIRLDPADWNAPVVIWSRFARMTVEHENIADYPARPVDEPTLTDVLRRLLLPGDDGVERECLIQYLGESERRTRTRVEYPLLLALARVKRLEANAFKVPAYSTATGVEWAGFEGSLRGLGSAHADYAQELRDAYAWSDNLATHFAQVFRSGHVTNFLLAAAAVLLALAGLLWPAGKLWLIVSELAVIVLLVVNTHVGRSRQWHRRWLDYRYIAERLRPMRSLRLFGLARAVTAAIRADPHGARWTDWYAQALWRQMGCPLGRVDDGYRKQLTGLVVAEELHPQIRYHDANAARMEKLEHRLHRLGNMLFIATIAAGTLFLGGYLAANAWAVAHATVFTAITAALPALGGAVYGIRVQGDFGGTAHRSLQTAHELRHVADALAADPARFTQAAAMAELGARVMLSDLAEWQLTYRQRNLDIPG
jgi:hypothetical protein